MPYSTYIFDLDGTLVDSVLDITEALNRTLSKHAFNIQLNEHQTRQMIGGGVKKLIQQAVQDHHFRFTGELKETQLEQMYADFMIGYEPIVTQQSTLYSGVLDTLKYLRQHLKQLAICTNKPIQPTLSLLKQFDIESLFDCIIGGDSLDKKKPHPKPLRHILKALSSDSDQCLFIGDSVTDYRTAEAAGIDFVFVTYGYHQGFQPPKTCQSIDSLMELRH